MRIELRNLHTVGKHSTPELCSNSYMSDFFFFLRQSFCLTDLELAL